MTYYLIAIMILSLFYFIALRPFLSDSQKNELLNIRTPNDFAKLNGANGTYLLGLRLKILGVEANKEFDYYFKPEKITWEEHSKLLVFHFMENAKLEVYNPSNIEERLTKIIITEASRVRWLWSPYGKDFTNERLRFLDVQKTDSGIQFIEKNSVFDSHKFNQNIESPFVEICD